MKVLWLLKSRKFWASVIGLVLVMFPDLTLGVDQVVDPVMQLISVGVIVAAYVVGTGIEDAGQAK